ncbi:hypothetical protein [Paenibacillus peoriae]|uniref:hypothetical protein n=1 Tax=Paenibacillus peoriae TaxID=59893 RepID=UPI00096BD51C|nr:hypothetical protein [Paenibacillus peoriae]OMF80714.1 hypothetical protein BK145_10530 [Paenibacillus peoriae]
MAKKLTDIHRIRLLSLLRDIGFEPSKVTIENKQGETEVIDLESPLPKGLQAVLNSQGSLSKEQLLEIEESVKQSREDWD